MDSERAFINRLGQIFQNSAAPLVKGIGDDCAVFDWDSQRYGLITTDALVENIHFSMDWHPPRLLGRKCIAVNVSDIAAMGGQPLFVQFAAAIDPQKQPWLDEFLAGMAEAVKQYNIVLTGGDTVKMHRDLFFSLTVIGDVPKKEICWRDGAKSGDDIWVSGCLGAAAAGLEVCQNKPTYAPHEYESLRLAHLAPEAQVSLGRKLAQGGFVHAMMDISDGLATDLAHICKASGLGAEVRAERLPVLAELQAFAARCTVDPMRWVLAGGEDFQLLFTAPAEARSQVAALLQEEGCVNASRIGKLCPGCGVRLFTGAEWQDITYQGYDHFSHS